MYEDIHIHCSLPPTFLTSLNVFKRKAGGEKIKNRNHHVLQNCTPETPNFINQCHPNKHNKKKKKETTRLHTFNRENVLQFRMHGAQVLTLLVVVSK